MVLKIHITLFLALLYNLYIAREKIFFIAYLFIVMHELSHMIVAILLNVDIEEIQLLPLGAIAKYKGNISLVKEFFISLAGPLASLLFAYCYHNNIYFKINICILIFNLLPIYPLDGGRIIRVITVSLFGKKLGKKIVGIINCAVISFLWLFAIYLLIKNNNISLLVISFYILKIYKDEMKKEKYLSIINYLQIEK